MYNVSQDYIDATKLSTIADYVTGTITLSDGTVIEITDADIALGTLNINKQCLDGDTLMFGCAAAAKLDISIYSDTSRYAFYDAEISLTYYLRTHVAEDEEDEDIYEAVPLGVYYVKDVDRQFDKLNITAYDGLSKLDVGIGSLIFSGNPFVILSGVCEASGLELGMTELELQALPNGEEIIQLDKTTNCKSYRDIVRYVAQMLGGFVAVDRYGRLIVRTFGNVSSIVDSLAEKNRYSYKPQDYSCQYCRISITSSKNTFISEDPETEGLTMYIQDAPAWDYGLTQTLQARADALLEYLLTVFYTPGELTIPSNPAYDCGDLIEMTYSNGDSLYFLVTEINWAYRGNTDLTSVGTNPHFNDVESIPSGGSSSGGGSSSADKLTLLTYTNFSPIEVEANNTDWHRIIRIIFVTNSETSVMFLANIDCDVTPPDKEIEVAMPVKDDLGNLTSITLTNGNTIDVISGTLTTDGNGELEFMYKYDNEEVRSFHPKDLVGLGNNLISLYFPISYASERSVHTFELHMKSDGSAVVIPANNIQAAIFGQHLADTELWDGIISLEDWVHLIDSIAKNIGVTGVCNVTFYTVNKTVLTDTVVPISRVEPSLQNITDNVIIKLKYLGSVLYMSQQFPNYMGGWRLV